MFTGPSDIGLGFVCSRRFTEIKKKLFASSSLFRCAAEVITRREYISNKPNCGAIHFSDVRRSRKTKKTLSCLQFFLHC